MICVDANVLLYAYQREAPQHQPCREWLEEAFSGPAPVLLPWQTLLAFLRIITNPRVYHEPLSMREAASILSSWLALPAVTVCEPGERFWEILQRLMDAGQVTGPLVTDAALAALSIEHGCTLYTTDADFSRFPGLRWRNPAAAVPSE